MSARLPAVDRGVPVIQVRGVSCVFGGLRAVDDVSFAAPAGRVTGLIGPNGAGKSTTLGVVAGAVRPAAGSVLYKGRDITSWPSYRRARQGLVRTFQMRGEFDHLTLLENLLVAAPDQLGEKARWLAVPGRRWRSQERALVEKARQLLERFELSDREDAYASELSGGQRRLMELARALMADPSALLLDEPMAGVNPTLSRQLGDHLLELAKSGLAVILVEHELRLIEQVCDHVVAMAQGRVIAEGTMSALREQAEVVDAYIVG